MQLAMSIKIFFLIIFIFIIISLVSALFNLVRHNDQENSAKVVKALSIRIGLSLFLFIMMFVAYSTGMIKPEGIGARMQMTKQKQSQNTNQIKP